MNLGETFLGFDIAGHLWVVIGKSADIVVLVNMTTHGRSPLCGTGDCVLIEPAEHSYVRHTTCIYYRKPETASDAYLDECKRRGTLDQREPVSLSLLRRIQQGALDSDHPAQDLQDIVSGSMAIP